MEQPNDLPIRLYEIYLDDEESLIVVTNSYITKKDILDSYNHQQLSWGFRKLLNYGKVRQVHSLNELPVIHTHYEPFADLDNEAYSRLWGVSCLELCRLMDEEGNIVLSEKKEKEKEIFVLAKNHMWSNKVSRNS